MGTEILEQAIESTRPILRAVRPDHLESATPCESWNVSEVINHLVGGQFFFAASVNGEQLSGEPTDFAAGNFVSAFDQGATLSVAAFRADGAMERTVRLPFGELPGAAFIGLAATDTFVHGWDLARATGQSTDLSPELAAELLARARLSLPDAFRGPDRQAPFGVAQVAPDGASAADELAAFLGRTV